MDEQKGTAIQANENIRIETSSQTKSAWKLEGS